MHILLYHSLLYIFTGAIAGLLAGMMGIGGGSIVVPCLLFMFSHQGVPHNMVMHAAAGTSLGVMIFTAISAIYAHHLRRNIIWPVFFKLLPGIFVGIIVGAILAAHLSTETLKIIFGLLLFILATRMLLQTIRNKNHECYSGMDVSKKPQIKLPNKFLLGVVGFLVGGKSGLLGIGGGAITIPFLTACNFPVKKAFAISSVCTFPIALIGAISFIIAGLDKTASIGGFVGYVYVPALIGVAIGSIIFAPVGNFLATKMKSVLLARIFSIFLFFVAINMLY